MCGIVGVATRNSRPAPDLVVRMRETMRHRGPDGAGLWSSPCGHVVLGHRRLAILDLSEAGAQRSEEHTSELQSLMRISYAVFCLKKKKTQMERVTGGYIQH